MTEKLYLTNSYLVKFKANVTSCTETENGFEVTLDKTAFFPEGGGQDSDVGIIGGAAVTHVFERGDDIVHITERAVSGECDCEADFAVRFDRMQQHTGEHIVCGIVHSLYGYENVGFHLGDTEVTFDFNGTLTKEQLGEIEILANRAVFENHPVKVHLPTADELKNFTYRSKLDLTDNVRLVEICGVDICACCAPHVNSTAEVGIIKFVDMQNYKGGVRISLACGMRAVYDYRIKQNNLSEIAKVLSSKENNASEFFKKYADDVADLKAELSKIRHENILLRAGSIENAEKIILFEDGLDMVSLRHFVNGLHGKYTDFCMVFSESENGYIFNGASDCRDMKSIASVLKDRFSAGCGGSSLMIQGSVNAQRRDIEKVLETI